MKPYLLMSDIHFHNWGQFAVTDSDGINSRLREILCAFNDACARLKDAGGDTVILAGDVFHVRGSLTPSVVNPVKRVLEVWGEEGLKFFAIDGNHDLESKDSDTMKSAIEVLSSWRFQPAHNVDAMSTGDQCVRLIPWTHNLDELRAKAKKHADAKHDLIIHAPLNGVIKGIPDTGLDPAEVESWGYKRVFCGHYHNARNWNNKVYSVGALTHQTWSDVGTLAGYMLVYHDHVEHFESESPKFVDYDMAWSEQEATEACIGNYVRVTLSGATEGALKEWRKFIAEREAKGSIFRVTPVVVTTARSSVASTTKTIEESITDWIKEHHAADALEINKKALIILGETA